MEMTLIKNTSNKKKYQYALIAIGLIAIAIYQFSIKNTIAAYGAYRDSKATGEEHNFSGFEAMTIKEKAHLLNKVFTAGSEGRNRELQSRDLLSATGDAARDNHVVLKEFPPPVVSEEAGYEVITTKITLEGPFHSLLKAIRTLEKNKRTGRVSSVTFASYTDYRTNEKKLTATCYVQQIAAHPTQ